MYSIEALAGLKMPQPEPPHGSSPLVRLKRIGRMLGLNTAYNSIWRRPIKELRALARDGGPLERRKTNAGHAAMREAAKTLPAMLPPDLDLGNRIHMLTGERFWYQSVYCVASLQLASEERVTPLFYSDGTLDNSARAHISRILPWAEFRDTALIDSQLDAILPCERFSSLRARRKDFILLRKLTDIHIFPEAWKLVLDSDMLFFRAPVEMLEWFRQPHSMHMLDIDDAYGYPVNYLQSLVGHPLPKRINSGLYGIESSRIDWSLLEYWCAQQLTDFGPSYLQEQGLTAMILAGEDVHALPEEEYVLMPTVREGRMRRAVMHHYVAHSKRSYFQCGWRAIDARLRSK
jgi:hypothetical protein